MAYIVKITDDVPQLKNRIEVAESSANYQADDYVDPFSIANFGTHNVATFEMQGIDLHNLTNKTYAETDSIGFIADGKTDLNAAVKPFVIMYLLKCPFIIISSLTVGHKYNHRHVIARNGIQKLRPGQLDV